MNCLQGLRCSFRQSVECLFFEWASFEARSPSFAAFALTGRVPPFEGKKGRNVFARRIASPARVSNSTLIAFPPTRDVYLLFAIGGATLQKVFPLLDQTSKLLTLIRSSHTFFNSFCCPKVTKSG